MRKMPLLAMLLVVMLLLSGCATTKVKNTWKHPQLTHKIKRVYLIGVTRNDKFRRIFENELVRQLKTQGVTGIPSYPDLVISGDIDREALRARLRAQGTDAVLVARIAGKEQRSAAYSAAESGYGVGTAPINVYYDEYYNSSVTIVAAGPAAENEYQLVSIRASIFETESAQVIWSMLTETSAGDDNREQRLREYTGVVMKKLQEDGML